MEPYNSYGLSEKNMGSPAMSNPPQPVEVDLSCQRVSGLFSSISYFLPFAMPDTHALLLPGSGISRTIHAPQPDFMLGGSQIPLANWYRANDGPWIPKGAVPEVGLNDKLHLRNHTPAFSSVGSLHPFGPHRPGNRSENGSAIYGNPRSDSGYDSKGSHETCSLRSYDTTNAHLEPVNDYRRSAEPLHGYPILGLHDSVPMNQRIPYAEPPILRCLFPTCGQQVKTRSELKKHDARHRRPHTCPHQDCPKHTVGFGTRNDLDRHIRSKHPRDPLEGRPGKIYHCIHGTCRQKKKDWPRLDNFRNHLKKSHRLTEEEVEEAVCRSALTGQTEERVSSKNGRTSESLSGPDIESEPNDDFYPESLDMDEPHQLLDPSLQADAMDWCQDIGRLGHPSELLDRELIVDSSPEPEIKATIDIADLKEDEPVAHAKSESPDNNAMPTHENSSQVVSEVVQIKPDETLPKAENSQSAISSDESDISSKGRKDNEVPLSIGADIKQVISTALAKIRAGKLARSRSQSCIPLAHSGIEPARDIKLIPKELSLDPSCSSLEVLESPLPKDVHGFGEPVPTGSSAPPNSLPGILVASPTSTNNEEPDDVSAILEAIKGHGYVIRKKETEVSNKEPIKQVTTPGPPMTKRREGPLKCEKCDFKGRRCQLTKHMKRHDKPYGCTNPKCDKIFGSKDDWKRHENSQHFKHETWRCQFKDCSRISYHMETFKAHLSKEHSISVPQLQKHIGAARHTSDDFPSKGWCGFCKTVIDFGLKGSDPWTQRFNHIDSHFMGRDKCAKQSIKDWIHGPDEVKNGAASVGSSNHSQDSVSPNSSPAETSSTSSSPESTDTPHPDGTSLKRRLTDSQDNRPSKIVRSNSGESRIFCCQCDTHFNPKTDSECCYDNHRFCHACKTRTVRMPLH